MAGRKHNGQHYHRQYRHGDVNKVAMGTAAPGEPRFVRKYVSTYAPKHPLAGKNGKVYVHRWVLFDKIGPGEHLCHWGCGKTVSWSVSKGCPGELVADHLDGQGDNNDPANLVPSCRPCNVSRDAPKRAARLRDLGWWSNHDTIARLKSGGRKA